MAYSPLGGPSVFTPNDLITNPTVAKVAAEANKTPAQVGREGCGGEECGGEGWGVRRGFEEWFRCWCMFPCDGHRPKRGGAFARHVP